MEGGGEGHITLVKLTTKRIVDTFPDLRYILISFEEQELRMDIKIRDGYTGYTNTTFNFRPDIVVRVLSKKEDFTKHKWNSILDSSVILFEAETNPQNFFQNHLKMTAYKKIKKDVYGRYGYAFVLVCWSDSKLPENCEPFDEIWKFDKNNVKG